VGSLDDFVPETYVPRVITIVQGIGEAGKTTAYIRRGSTDLGEDPDSYIAISTRCAHLGCPVRFVQAAGNFICPCHGGVYGFQGEVIGGPPVRPLDRFYTRVRGGLVEIGPRFSVNSELQRFSPRDPGEPLDGVSQYLYPSTPDLRKIDTN
jgi:nitrite reductase/ring-hydroxylating ferredoxin subunit